MLFSVEQAFVGRDEKRAPLKTPAWETRANARYLKSNSCVQAHFSSTHPPLWMAAPPPNIFPELTQVSLLAGYQT